MTQSDETSGREASCKSKLLEDRLTGEQTGSHPAEKEARGREGPPIAAPKRLEETAPFNGTEMGSTDSAANAHGGGSSCGLVGSLFPNSCRGRAESFARRLHRRLTSLGSEASSATSEDDAHSVANGPTEASWLHAPLVGKHITTTIAPSNSASSLPSSTKIEERVLERQPRHSPESDLFYDFEHPDDDDNNLGSVSPAEIANPTELAKLLVNPRIINSSHHHETCHCSPGPRPPEHTRDSHSPSECVFSSPISGLSPETDDSEAYFDPESSETEKSRAETFFDPQATSESDAPSSLSNGTLPTKLSKLPSRRRTERNFHPAEKLDEDDSESSNSSPNDGTIEGALPTGTAVPASSEESLNGKSSLETTSASHESLWSTFDDSTVSLQDESPLATTSVDPAPSARLPKSHSDSEIAAAPSRGIEQPRLFGNQQPRDQEEHPTANGTDGRAISKIDQRLGLEKLSLDDLTENDHSIYSSSIDIPDALIPECPSEQWLSSAPCKNASNEVVLRVGEATEKVDEALREGEAKRDGEPESDEREEAEAKEDNDNDGGNDDDDEDEDDSRPQRVRRCSSLKTGKTPPGTPGRKKIVRFADVLGLDLADVRTFLDEIPKVPNSAYSDLRYEEAFQKDSSPVNFWGTGPATFTTPLFAATMGARSTAVGPKIDRILVPLFQQPGGLANFLDLVRERLVCLENVLVQDPVTMCLQGTVRVRNLDFHKSVHARYTLDSWRNFSDLQATYAVNSCDGFSDKFTFTLYCHTLKVGQRLELAVRFQCKGAQYWDNNAGENYCFQCLPATPANTGNYIPITAPSTGNTGNHEWSPAFY